MKSNVNANQPRNKSKANSSNNNNQSRTTTIQNVELPQVIKQALDATAHPLLRHRAAFALKAWINKQPHNNNSNNNMLRMWEEAMKAIEDVEQSSFEMELVKPLTNELFSNPMSNYHFLSIWSSFLVALNRVWTDQKMSWYDVADKQWLIVEWWLMIVDWWLMIEISHSSQLHARKVERAISNRINKISSVSRAHSMGQRSRSTILWCSLSSHPNS